jgi:hypothetical protein
MDEHVAPRLDGRSRRLLTAFSANLNRLNPQPLDWQRLYDFILYAFGHEPPSAAAVGHTLVQDGLDWDEAEPFVLFYMHAIELLGRQATLARRALPASQRKRKPPRPPRGGSVGAPKTRPRRTR